MKCIICGRQLRSDNKYEMCSNCQGTPASAMIRKGRIKLEDFKEILKIKHGTIRE